MSLAILRKRRARLQIMARAAALYRKGRASESIVSELFEKFGRDAGIRDRREMEHILLWAGTNSGGFDFKRKFEGKSPSEVRSAFLKWYNSPKQKAVRVATSQLRELLAKTRAPSAKERDSTRRKAIVSREKIKSHALSFSALRMQIPRNQLIHI